MGITLLFLSFEGNWPLVKLRLKMWERGWEISLIINLIILDDIPSQSGLFFADIFFTVFTMCSGVVFCRFRLAKWGFSGKYWAKFILETGTASEMSFPTFTKKLLNVFAISVGSESISLSLLICEIVLLVDFLPIVSFRIFQVSLGFFLCSLSLFKNLQLLGSS